MSNQSTDVVVIGLGRVGLPQALLLAGTGWTVCGVDNDAEHVSHINAGKAPFFEPGMGELMSRVVENGTFSATHTKKLAGHAQSARFYIVTVGTPFDVDTRQVMREGLFSLMRQLFSMPLRPGATIILRTSIPVGTTDLIKDISKREFQLQEGSDYHLVYIPERVAEGKVIHEEPTLPKLVGAYSEEGFRLSKELFRRQESDLIRLSSPSAAEFAKLVDNSYRNTMFAFANELARAAEEADLDAWEIIDACNTRYSRNNIPIPGPVSGYCLGKDPYLLGQTPGESLDGTPVLDYPWIRARLDNDQLCGRVAHEVAEYLRNQNRTNPRVLILGLAFKEGVDDFRMSHAFDIIKSLRSEIPGLILSLYDPAVGSTRYSLIPSDLASIVDLTASILEEALNAYYDAIVIATPDSEIRSLTGPDRLVASQPDLDCRQVLVFDCWNIWRKAEPSPTVVYRSVGVGSSFRRG